MNFSKCFFCAVHCIWCLPPPHSEEASGLILASNFWQFVCAGQTCSKARVQPSFRIFADTHKTAVLDKVGRNLICMLYLMCWLSDGLCAYHRWFGRPQNAACPSYWESPMGNAKLHRILRFCMGSHHLPVEEGRHFNLPRAICVCNLCDTDASGDARHMLLECPALADLRLQFSSLLSYGLQQEI